MVKLKPHAVPQDRLAVPLPSALNEVMVNVLPVVVLFPHPLWLTSLALVAVPLAFRVNVTRPDPTPHPPCPYSAKSQFPVRFAGTITLAVELLTATPA